VFQSMPSLQNPPLIVFQTAYSEHAAEAFDINALDYLLKPVRFERLQKTVEKIQNALNASQAEAGAPTETLSPVHALDQIAVNDSGNTTFVPVKDILRISFEDGFSYIYTISEKLISDKYLNFYEEKLKNGPFFRTSRTDIINLNCITMIHKMFAGAYIIELKNGMRIDLSRRKAQALRKIIDF